MTKEQILAQLWAVRAIVDALAASLQADQATETGCSHPEDARENATTLGGPAKFYCKACKEIVEDV